MAETAGDVFVDTIIGWGVDTIFGIPAGHLARRRPALKIEMKRIRYGVRIRHWKCRATAE